MSASSRAHTQLMIDEAQRVDTEQQAPDEPAPQCPTEPQPTERN